MEAIEGNKSDQAMKLRVVIQFIRVSFASLFALSKAYPS